MGFQHMFLIEILSLLVCYKIHLVVIPKLLWLLHYRLLTITTMKLYPLCIMQIEPNRSRTSQSLMKIPKTHFLKNMNKKLSSLEHYWHKCRVKGLQVNKW